MEGVYQGMSAVVGWARAADSTTPGSSGQLPVEFAVQEGLQEPPRLEVASMPRATRRIGENVLGMKKMYRAYLLDLTGLLQALVRLSLVYPVSMARQ